MTTPLVDADRIEAAARALLDHKVTAVRVLAEARQTREDAKTALVDAERGDATAYASALKAGWTADELKRVGLDGPSRRASGRPCSPRRSASPTPSTARTQASDGSVSA